MDAFIKIPIWLLTMDISSNAKVLYAYLQNGQQMNGKVQIPIGKIAEGIHVSRRTIQRSLKELEEKGLIRISRQFSNAPISIEVLNMGCQNDTPPCQNDTSDVPNWHGGYAKMTHRTCQNDTPLPYIKEINKRNNKRSSKRTCARAGEEQTYDIVPFLKKDSFPRG